MGENAINAAAKENPLGYEPIGKLIRTFAIPSVVAFVISSLYNIVDQLFIGWGVGYLGNAATNIIVPMTVVMIALGLLIGDGAAAFIALNLGVGRKDRAAKGAGGAILLSVIISILLSVVFSIFLTPLCRFLGATETILPYAVDYGRIIVIGFVFALCDGSFAALLRADGRPRISMMGMVLGCITNFICDPLFIFVFGWGVKGAALATILGQIVNFVFFIFCFRRMKSFSLKASDILKPERKVIKKTLTLGLSSFITQCAGVVLSVLMNRSLVKWGAASIYGADITLAVFGIVAKINNLICGIPIGIAGGSQPIYGFNYSSGQHDRVKKTLLTAWSISTVIMIAAFFLYHLFPRQLIGIFGSESELYNQFAVLCFRISTALIFLMPTSACISIFFQAIGRPAQALVVSLCRQVLILIPCVIILPLFFGLNGLLAAMPA
ncbi:MAG: MATE family efflux transporter, partial [Lachnospiraceae bacterium]|nr:MATE family efflux transporter [Lachnospiraceae bacterium]